MKKEQLFSSSVLLSAMGGLGGQMVFAGRSSVSVFPTGLAWTAALDSLEPGVVESDADDTDYTSFIQNSGFEDVDTVYYCAYSVAGNGSLQFGAWFLGYDVNGGSYINLFTQRTVEKTR